MNKAIIAVAFALLIPQAILANDEVCLDNRYIQQYHGYLGIWVSTEYPAKLANTVEQAGSTLEDVEAFNGGSVKTKSYVFVPYSDERLQRLEDSGIIRKTIKTKDTDFIWPLDSLDRISSPFGFRNRQLHTGVDMPAAIGSPIIAAMDGIVVSAGYHGGHGNSILVRHKNNFYTRYSHNSAILVKVGDEVIKGQMIAFSGNTGRSTGPHLHFEIRFNEVPLNPLDFLPQDKEIVIVKHKPAKYTSTKRKK